jgi:hypothetical protein
MPRITLPAAYYFSGDRDQPTVGGGFIERRQGHTNCPTWELQE